MRRMLFDERHWIAILTGVSLIAALAAGCGDDMPSAKEECAASCESRGGEFYLMQGEYCYCSFTDGFDGGTD